MSDERAKDLLKTDFVNSWVGDPRSLPYRQGFQIGYEMRITGEPDRKRWMKLPSGYRPGSVEYDAWLSGWEHGGQRAEIDLMRLEDELSEDDGFRLR